MRCWGAPWLSILRSVWRTSARRSHSCPRRFANCRSLGLHSRATPGIHSRADPGIHSGADPGIHSGVWLRVYPGADPGSASPSRIGLYASTAAASASGTGLYAGSNLYTGSGLYASTAASGAGICAGTGQIRRQRSEDHPHRRRHHRGTWHSGHGSCRLRRLAHCACLPCEPLERPGHDAYARGLDHRQPFHDVNRG